MIGFNNILKAQGVKKYAVEFDGIQGHAIIDFLANSLNIAGTQSATIGAWVWLDGSILTGYTTLINLGRTDLDGAIYLALRKANDNHYAATVRSSAQTVLESTQTMPFGQWVHFYTVYDGTNLLCYADGVLVASIAATGNIVSPIDRITLGTWLALGQFYDGKMYDVRVYSDAKTAAEILAMSNGFDNQTNLEGHWKLDEGEGTTIADSANGNNGALSALGAVWVER